MGQFTKLLFVASCVGPAYALNAEVVFEKKAHKHNVFSVIQPGHAAFSYNYMPYTEWLEKGSGKDFPMDVAPALSGLLSGRIQTPAPHPIDESQYVDQAKEFAHMVNERNLNGRAKIDLMNKTPEENYKEAVAGTYVVEILLSAVIDKPLAQLNLTAPDRVADLAEKIDVDHYHFQIPGTFVTEVLEEGHSQFATVRPDRNYLLSVFDLREYSCAVMKDGIRDYFSKATEKERLHNESIYLITQVELNQPGDIAHAEKYFGRRPDAVIRQQAIFADHLVRASNTLFAFFSEGAKTRVVLLSSLGMKNKYFVGAKGLLIRQYVLDGVTGGAIGAITGRVIAPKDGIAELLDPATKDVNQKNACNRGLALGLIRYSQSLFSEFTGYLVK